MTVFTPDVMWIFNGAKQGIHLKFAAARIRIYLEQKKKTLGDQLQKEQTASPAEKGVIVLPTLFD